MTGGGDAFFTRTRTIRSPGGIPGPGGGAAPGNRNSVLSATPGGIRTVMVLGPVVPAGGMYTVLVVPAAASQPSISTTGPSGAEKPSNVTRPV
jgi:hypothetical protein